MLFGWTLHGKYSDNNLKKNVKAFKLIKKYYNVEMCRKFYFINIFIKRNIYIKSISEYVMQNNLYKSISTII